MIAVKLPDGSIAQFPDGTSKEVMQAAIAQKLGAAAPAAAAPSAQGLPTDNYLQQGLSGVNEGIANMAGFPVDMAAVAINAGMSGINSLTGTNLQHIQDPFGGSASFRGLMAPTIAPESQDAGQQFTRRIGQEVGSMLIPGVGPVARSVAPMRTLGAELAASIGSGTGAAVAEQVAPGNPLAEFGGQLIGGFTPGGIAAATRRAASPGAPTVQALKDEAGVLYDDARASGVEMNQGGTISLSDDMFEVARSEGLISPTGRVSAAYPKISEALKTFDDYSNGTMNVTQMQSVRKTLQDAAKSVDPGERRIGTVMLNRFDEMVDQGVPQLREANAIYHRAKKGELIETAIELAASRAGQFSGSGFENALRTEFRQLEREIIKGKLKGISEEEAEAISKVAKGGPLENIARYIGKFSPTGVVSFAAGAGIPFAVGNAVGGPLLGAGAAGVTMGAGLGGRAAATALQKRNAAIASALMRNGGTPSAQPLMTPDQRAVAQALLLSQGANQNVPLDITVRGGVR